MNNFSPDLTVHVMSDNERQRVEWAFLPSVSSFLPSLLLPFLGIAGVHYLPFPPSLSVSPFVSIPPPSPSAAEQSGVDK